MLRFYQFFIQLYFIAIKIAALFNPKAKLWLVGRKHIFEKLKAVNPKENNYWFHCASLGELEQAKPLIEKLKEDRL